MCGRRKITINPKFEIRNPKQILSTKSETDDVAWENKREKIKTQNEKAKFKKDYTNFFTHALKSANECKFWLGLLRDSGKGDRETVNKLLREATEIANILATSILTLRGKRRSIFTF